MDRQSMMEAVSRPKTSSLLASSSKLAKVRWRKSSFCKKAFAWKVLASSLTLSLTPFSVRDISTRLDMFRALGKLGERE